MSNTLALINAKTTRAKNPLNAYRSYTYVFTLAALKKGSLADPNSYRQNEDYFVIAKTGGKGTAGLKMPTSSSISKNAEDLLENKSLIENFNKNSPGRFDFYINNVNVDTIMAGDERTSMSLATKIEFDVTEPYSMSGFIEALQVSAVAAGYDQYVNAVYLLKMEFIGYPDADELPNPETVKNSTRYFVFGFTGLEIDVTESGARYRCSGVPFNEKGFGEPSKLKSNITLKGETVGAILKSFQNGLNEAKQSDAASVNGSENKRDQYEIVFPEVNETGIVPNSENKSIRDSKVVELLKTPAVYGFSDPGVVANTSTNTVPYVCDPKIENASTFFAEGANIHECIASILRDSDYIREILSKFPNNVDQYGMVPYFMVNLEVEETGEYDSQGTKPFYKYRYVVVPYKIHYSRILLTLNRTVDISKLTTIVCREYDYIYTGANTDIIKFNLKFNTLFFQAVPIALGNKKDQPVSPDVVQPNSYVNLALISNPEERAKAASIGVQPTKTHPDFTPINPKGVANSGQQSKDPYATLAKSLHQAILDNVDQVQAEIDIIGDPFYLVTGGMGNYRPSISPDGTGVGEGEAPYTTSDVLIILTFRNPTDIDPVTGEVIFDQVAAPYSGVFRVIQVSSSFKDGQFTQTLKLIRIPAQLIDTNVPIRPREPVLETKPDLVNTPTPEKPPVVSTLRAPADSLMASITAGLPVSGLPGQFSQLVPNLTGALAPSISSAAAGIVQWGKTAVSAGITNGENLAGSALSAGLSSVEAIGSNALSAVQSAGSQAAGAISNITSKISALNGGSVQGLLKDAVSGINPSALGIDTSKLSGLSANLQSKVADQISAAVKTIPENVDINAAVNNGLILNNLPKSALARIPATQPFSIAPPALPSLVDLKEIVNRGGSLANIPGAEKIPGVDKLLAAAGAQIPGLNTLDASAIAGKLSTIQSAVGNITQQVSSVESAIGKISSAVPLGLPNVADISTSVTEKFGSVSAKVASPLTTLIKSIK